MAFPLHQGMSSNRCFVPYFKYVDLYVNNILGVLKMSLGLMGTFPAINIMQKFRQDDWLEIYSLLGYNQG